MRRETVSFSTVPALRALSCCGRWAVDEDEIDRLLREVGLELPYLEDDGPDNAGNPLLDSGWEELD